MKNPMSKIERLKNKVRRAYRCYHNALDELSCGRALGEFISTTASQAKQEFNTAMNELAKLDPSVPVTRL